MMILLEEVHAQLVLIVEVLINVIHVHLIIIHIFQININAYQIQIQKKKYLDVRRHHKLVMENMNAVLVNQDLF